MYYEEGSLPYWQEEELNERVDDAWKGLLEDEDFLEEVQAKHHAWCILHGKEEETLGIPMNRLSIVLSKFPKEQVKFAGPEEEEFEFNTNDKWFFVSKEKFGWEVFSSNKLDFYEPEEYRDVMKYTLDEMPYNIEDIYSEYSEASNEYCSRQAREKEANDRLCCWGTPYQF